MSCFVGSFSIEAHLADVVLHGMWMLFLSLEFKGLQSFQRLGNCQRKENS